ncbi:CAP domain-containing protein [Aspergillus falconensis]
MKYSMILGVALCALGAMAEVEPSYVTEWTTTTVTDWTIVTITKTITVAPTSTATSTTTSVPAPTSAPGTQVKVQDTAPAATAETEAAVEKVPASTSSSTVEWTSTEVAEQPEATTWSSAWSSAWSSTWSTTQAATTETAAQSTATASSTQTAANAYQSNVLYSHNIHRANHSSPDVTWSSDLESSAQILASRCVYEHDTSINGGGYGQNIGYGTSADEVAVMISNLMYNDEMGYYENLYGQATPDMSLFEKWGHFSQIVWKGTTEVGCATVSCPSLGNVDSASAVPFTVCNYSPAGNYDGEYADNVLKPLGHAMWVAS